MNARDYLTLLREGKFLIMGCVVVCLALAGGVTVITPKSYESSVTFYVVAGTTGTGQQQNPTSELYSGAQLAKDRVKSYTELIVGPKVAEDAATALGGGDTPGDVQSRLEVSTVQDTVLFTVSATDRTPADAVAVVSAVSDSFTRLVEQLETRPGEAGPAVTVKPVQEPTTPLVPVGPRLGLNLAIGGLLGLLIGFGAAIARRSMDVSVRSAEELEHATEAAVLGVVPEDSARVSARGEAVSGPRAEAFRRIRTNLEFANVDGTSRVLVVTSALSKEGKTTATCDLAAALAAVGNRVVLVDGDLRRPAAAAVLGLESSVGLTTVLTGKIDLRRALQTSTPGGFDVLASGRRPPRPNELLSSRRAKALIDELRAQYDFVLVDAPPMLPVADAANLGTHADGAVVVCRWGRTSRHHVASAVSFLRSVSVPIVGTILSRAPGRAEAIWSHYGTYSDGQLENEAIPPAPPNLGVSNWSPPRDTSSESESALRGAVADTVVLRKRTPETSPTPEMSHTPMSPTSTQNGHQAQHRAPRPDPVQSTPRPQPRPSPAPRPKPPEHAS